MKTCIILLILLSILFFYLINRNEKFSNYIAYYDYKDFYTRFLDRFHGMKPNYNFIHDYHNQTHLLDYKSNPMYYKNLGKYFHQIPHNLKVIRV